MEGKSRALSKSQVQTLLERYRGNISAASGEARKILEAKIAKLEEALGKFE